MQAAAFAVASNNAAALVASRPAFLNASAKDEFVQRGMQSSGGHVYVPYERTHAGLPVVGGDFVMVLDGAGQLVHHTHALTRPIDLPSTKPTLSQAAAQTIASQRLRSVTNVEGTELVVHALGESPRLAWETTVNGVGPNGISRLTVDVDAHTGAILREQEHVMFGTGTAAWNGPNPITINTTLVGSTFSMKDPTITNLSCQDAANNTTFSKTTDTWGNGNATVRETGCVDALFGIQSEARMLTQWLGRNAPDGAGGAWPIRVGLAQVNAFYDGSQIQIGHNNANQWIGAIDVIAHEAGHGIDDHTPGGISGSGTQEFVADVFGAATESFTNEPAPFDVPDFTVGEQVNLVGAGPIRNMANPSLVNGNPNCYSSSIPSTEVHAAAGPGNHWFYLLAQGSNPTNGQPTSPTCNGSTVVGIGTQAAMKIMYTAMLMKTTASSYLNYRIWTLQAAINLNPGSCAQYNTVKAAWDAVSVPATADPTCGGGGGGGGGGTNLLLNPGFESGATSWTATTGVLGNTGTAHAGTGFAWLNGYGTTHTDSLFQQVAIPSTATTAQLCYFLRITTAETTTTTQFDKLTVQLRNSANTVLTTLGTFSNLNAGAFSAYTKVCHNVGSFAGQTVRAYFQGTEDSSLQTSFFIDDTSLQ